MKSIFTLGFIVGIGFGFAEFLLYVFVLGAPVLIRLPALLFHAASTSIASYGVATRRSVAFYLTAVFLHFANNVSALLGSFWLIGGPATLVVTYYLCWRLYNTATEKPAA